MFCSGFGFGGPYGGGGFFMMIPMLLILLITVYFIHKAFNNNKNNSTHIFSSKAMNILNERFAKGEISEEEYISKKQKIVD